MATFRIRDLIVAVGPRLCAASDTRPACAASGTLPQCAASDMLPDCAASGTLPHCAVSGPPPPCAASDTRPNVFGGTRGYAGEPSSGLQAEELALLKRQLAEAIGRIDRNDRSS
jgi:hypothetical protein